MCKLLTETKVLAIICSSKYSAKNIRANYDDFPNPALVRGKRKFYLDSDIEKFYDNHGNISGEIGDNFWPMPSRMALDFVKGVYS